MIELRPRLSAEDPIAATGGTIDPLGTSAIADSLAERLVPGVRERHHRARLLTAIAVSMAVCESFEDQIAPDGVTEPYLIFEWHVAEVFVRKLPPAELSGIRHPQSDIPVGVGWYPNWRVKDNNRFEQG